MGYVMVVGTCIRCGQLNSFNPHHVPSIRIDGVREPICKYCIPEVNRMRREHGAPEIVLHPEAYEPMNEEEL